MGAMIGTKAQQNQFNARLGRIATGGINTSKHLYVGPVEDTSGRGNKNSKRQSDKVTKILSEGPKEKVNVFGELVMIPIALFCGALAILAARVVVFRYMTEMELYTATHYGVPGSIVTLVAVCAVFVLLLRGMLNLKTPTRSRAFLVGLAAMIFLENLVVAQFPDAFALLYSDAYVSQVITKLN